MGQVLAQLGRVDPGGAASASLETVSCADLGEAVQRPQILRADARPWPPGRSGKPCRNIPRRTSRVALLTHRAPCRWASCCAHGMLPAAPVMLTPG